MTQAFELKEQVRKHETDFASAILYFLHDDDYNEYNDRLFEHRTDTLCWIGVKEELIIQIAGSGIDSAIEQAVQTFRQNHEKVILELIDLKSDDTIPNAIAMIEKFIQQTYLRYWNK